MPDRKSRIEIPSDTAARVMFESDMTCCVCRIGGKPTQIHHVNENPADNRIENLSVLCLECHDKTQIRGGFGRKLNASIVVLYRDSWLDVVRMRRSALTLRRELSGIVGPVPVQPGTSERLAQQSVPPTSDSRTEAELTGAGQTYRHIGIQITIIDVRRTNAILLEKRSSYDDEFEEEFAGPGAEYVSIETRVLNDANVSIDLTCSYPVGNKLVDVRGRQFDAIEKLYRIPGNPRCNANLQPGFESSMTWVYRIPEWTEVAAFEFEDLADFSAPRNKRPTRIPIQA